ncbi:hypothetical protein BC629DRAFT_1556719 [Irpex lacteus]|nr:hypothetical protein BC629DRAFT_1556719 [Irpex lacteus]
MNEHRIVSYASSGPRLIRLSIGVEDVEDLKDDLKQALQAVVKVVERLSAVTKALPPAIYPSLSVLQQGISLLIQ